MPLRARRQPSELAHNEFKVALNRGEIRACLIGLAQRQRVVGLVSKAGHITCLAGRAPLFLAYR